MLRQAIENLIDNAAAHGGPGAVEVDVRADPAAGQVEVVVADRGAAEAPEGGHGIGLFVVRRFLDEAGGTSWAAPRDGGGTLVGLRAAAASRQTGSTGQRRQHLNGLSGSGQCGNRSGSSWRRPRRVRRGLGMVLSAQDDLEVVALAGDGASALQAVLTHHPDVLVVDTQMPGPAVTELVRLVGQAEPATRVLLLAEDARLAPSSRPDPGGHAGMTRAVSARELAEAIRAVAAGFRVTLADPPAPVAAAPPAGRVGQPTSPGPSQAGRPRRAAAAQPVGARAPGPGPARPWLPNRRIADACFLSLNTVRTHVQNVLVKLGVHSKLEAAALAVRQGLVGIEARSPRRPRPEPGGRRRPWVPARSSQLPQGRRRRRGRAGARLALLALAPRRRPGRPGGARGPAGPAAGRAGRCGHPAHRPHPDLAGTGLLGQPAAGLAAAPGAGGVRGRHRADADPHRGRPHPRAGRRRPAGRIGVRTGLLAAGEGFSGFLVGAGGGRLDHRAAAMVQGASGEGGGILCTYEADGRVGFREHTDEARQFAYAPSPAPSTPASPAPGPWRRTSSWSWS